MPPHHPGKPLASPALTSYVCIGGEEKVPAAEAQRRPHGQQQPQMTGNGHKGVGEENGGGVENQRHVGRGSDGGVEDLRQKEMGTRDGEK